VTGGKWAGGSADDPMAPPPEGPRYLMVRVAALWFLLSVGIVVGVGLGLALGGTLQ
jgi:hypothetical protein